MSDENIETNKINETNETNETENMFDNVDDVESEFANSGNDIPEMNNAIGKEFTFDDVRQSNFTKLPEVGKTETYVIEKIIDNPNTKATNKTTGEEFAVGVTNKTTKETIRRDVVTDKGTFTITSWGVFYKFFGVDKITKKPSKLMEIVGERKKKTGSVSFTDVEVTITHNYNGNYAMKPLSEVMKLMDMTEEEATAYKITVAKAIKENTLYDVVFRDLLVEEPKAEPFESEIDVL